MHSSASSPHCFGEYTASAPVGYLSAVSAQHEAAGHVRRPSRMTSPAHGNDEHGQVSGVDETLVAGMARGDEAAATQLYDRYSAVVYGLALRVAGEAADAEEIVIETFAQAWREAARFDASKGSVIAWLTVMTRSRALDVVRARQRRQRATEKAGHDVDIPAAMSQAAPPADALLVQAERASAVTTALQALPSAQRYAIELAFFEGLTHPEVAERLNEPLGTVKTRIRLGLHKLRDALSGLAPAAEDARS